MMSILHINSYYGNRFFYRNLFDEQVKIDLDIKVFVPVQYGFKVDFDLGEYTTISENHGKFDRLNYYTKHKKIYNDLKMKYNLNKIKIIHAHSLFSNGLIAYKANKEFNVPYIVAIRSTDVNFFFKKTPFLKKLGLKIIQNASNIIFLSEPYKEQVKNKYIPSNQWKNFESKSVVIPNGVDNFWFNNLGTPRKFNKDNVLKILQVGELNQNKNVSTTIKTLKLLNEMGLSTVLNVVGKDIDSSIKTLISEEPKVNYLGEKNRHELLEIYRSNDIFVLPSINETFGLVYAEAMTQGLPLIYTKDQGFDKQFLDGEVGYPVKAMDHKDICDNIISILNSYVNISKNCIDKSDEFKWKKIATEYKELYNLI